MQFEQRVSDGIGCRPPPTEALPTSTLRSTQMSGRAFLRRKNASGFTLIEVLVALGVVAVGFLGAFAMVLQSGKMVSAAEEDALVCSGVEQRMDKLRELEWDELTSGTGITSKVWTARPETMSGITISQEALTISAYDVANAKTLNATWVGTSSPSVSLTSGSAELSTASAVKVTASLTWTGRRSKRAQTRSLVTVISKGGISKSDL